jgi:hypothetical protein
MNTEENESPVIDLTILVLQLFGFGIAVIRSWY